MSLGPDAKAAGELKAALESLRTKGWMRGKMVDWQTGKCCALGAFGYLYPTDSPGVPYLAHAVKARRGAPNYQAMSNLAVIIRFNDAPRRTAEQVEAAFEAAIRLAEEGIPDAK